MARRRDTPTTKSFSGRAVSSWNDLAGDLLTEMGETFVYRGLQRADWKCECSLQRAFRSGGLSRERKHGRDGWDDWEQLALSWFRAHAAAHIQDRPDDDDLLNWLVLMQHHGAPTRLLDWTESAFIGVYFAYRSMPTAQATPGRLWRLESFAARGGAEGALGIGRDDFQRQMMTLTRKTVGGATELERRLPRLDDPPWKERQTQWVLDHIRSMMPVPLPIVPDRPSPRMVAQQTVLTVVGDLSQPVEESLRKNKEAEGGRYLTPQYGCIELPVEWRVDVMKSLRMMGITESTLFPGLDGIGRETRMLLETGSKPVRAEFESMWFHAGDLPFFEDI